ncbi:MAG: hypothetical protein JSR85_04240 [Proteobacteria bacterium]|nr:hypothetical protein [Pseudomonadota bacterium]
MKLGKNTKKLFLSSIAIAAFLTINKADAGIVRVVNHSHNNIKINVIPEPSSELLPYCWKCFDGCVNPNGRQIREIEIPLDAFRGNEYYAVIGTEGGFLFNGKCRNLNVLKNYEVAFYETSLGVSCKSTEI